MSHHLTFYFVTEQVGFAFFIQKKKRLFFSFLFKSLWKREELWEDLKNSADWILKGKLYSFIVALHQQEYFLLA